MKLSLSSLCTIVVLVLATSTAGRSIRPLTDNPNPTSPSVFTPNCIQDKKSLQAADLHEIDLSGWFIGDSLFHRIISGYNADYNEYTADSYGQFILEQCKSNPACTAAWSYSAINSGTPKDRYWFGYIFGRGPATPDDFELISGLGVRDVRVYSI